MPRDGGQLAKRPRNPEGYKYKPLRNSHDIRILALFPSKTKIRCNLVHVSLDDCPPYEALSYVWGDISTTHSILVNDAEYTVGNSLHEALWRFSPSSFPKYLWVDAICINQGEISERSAQVQMMRQIYGKASRVLVWLGGAQDDSDIAMAFVSANAHAGLSPAELQREELHGMWVAQSHLVRRPWWNRVWCLQEISVPKEDPLLVCGTKEIPFSHFTEFYDYLSSIPIESDLIASLAVNFILENTSCFAGVRKQYQSQSFENRTGLSRLLRYATKLKATEPRDKIYALLGLSNRETRSVLIPDYSKAIADVYSEAARYVVRTTQSLNFLHEKRIPSSSEKPTGLPSWVPDWYLSARETSGMSRLVYRATKQFPATTHKSSPNILRVNGLFLDRVEHISEPLALENLTDVRSSLGKLTVMLEKAKSAPKRPLNPAHALEMDPRVSDAIWRTLIADSYTTEEADSIHPAPADLAQLFEITLYGPGDAPRPWRCVASSDGFLNIPTLRTPPRPSIPGNFKPQMDPADRMLEYLQPLFMRLIIFTGSRFFVTEAGRIGIVQRGSVMTGDAVALLMGADVPMILRPREQEKPYEFVCEAYVHGIMDGEAFTEKDEDGKVPEPGIIELG